MSATACIAKQKGFTVLGSDASEVYEPAKSVLEDQDIQYFSGYASTHVATSSADIFVVSAGEDTGNPEVAWLTGQDKTITSFPELLFALSQDEVRIVVTGTHGKSTTTGLIGHLLKALDDSSFMTGAVLQDYDTNFHVGSGHYFVFEGDEYKSTFEDPTPKVIHYGADILVLNNLEFDHPDMFPTLEAEKDEFAEMVARVPEDGLIIYNSDDTNLKDVVYRENKRAFSFGIHNEAEMKILETSFSQGGAVFTVENKLDPHNIRRELYRTELVGELNVYNALAAITTLRALGFQPEAIGQHLATYKGVKRRFEVVSETNDVTIIDDFAHHPTAVRETLAAARVRFPKANIWAVFEPHTYTRTKATLEDLAKSFSDAGQVLLAPMYGAREKQDVVGITDAEVLEAIVKNQPSTRALLDREDALRILKTEVKPGDVVIVMSAGTFNKLAYELTDFLSN